jgi:hypothetical protein
MNFLENLIFWFRLNLFPKIAALRKVPIPSANLIILMRYFNEIDFPFLNHN